MCSYSKYNRHALTSQYNSNSAEVVSAQAKVLFSAVVTADIQQLSAEIQQYMKPTNFLSCCGVQDLCHLSSCFPKRL